MTTEPTRSPLKADTLAVRAGYNHSPGDGVVPPVQLSATFVTPGMPSPEDFTYARGGSPAEQPLELALAQLEGGTEAVLFNAGIAAAFAVLDETAPNSVLVMPCDAYFGIRVRAEAAMPGLGIEVRLVDQTDLHAIAAALDGASMLWTETPTNPLLAIADLQAIGEIAARLGVPWACDNTFASPILQHPLDYGATAVMHSVTKYIGGHSDLILGAVITRDADLAARMRARRSMFGTQPDGFSSWLARRGVQTLPLRVRRQSETALEIAKRLSRHPAVAQVYYPGLPTHPGHEIAARQMGSGFGGMLSFVVQGGVEAAERVVERCEIWVPATSLGSVESLIERRARWAGETADPALLRLSAGLEDPDDLWRDLDRALSN